MGSDPLGAVPDDSVYPDNTLGMFGAVGVHHCGVHPGRVGSGLGACDEPRAEGRMGFSVPGWPSDGAMGFSEQCVGPHHACTLFPPTDQNYGKSFSESVPADVWNARTAGAVQGSEGDGSWLGWMDVFAETDAEMRRLVPVNGLMRDWAVLAGRAEQCSGGRVLEGRRWGSWNSLESISGESQHSGVQGDEDGVSRPGARSLGACGGAEGVQCPWEQEAFELIADKASSEVHRKLLRRRGGAGSARSSSEQAVEGSLTDAPWLDDERDMDVHGSQEDMFELLAEEAGSDLRNTLLRGWIGGLGSDTWQSSAVDEVHKRGPPVEALGSVGEERGNLTFCPRKECMQLLVGTKDLFLQERCERARVRLGREFEMQRWKWWEESDKECEEEPAGGSFASSSGDFEEPLGRSLGFYPPERVHGSEPGVDAAAMPSLDEEVDEWLMLTRHEEQLAAEAAGSGVEVEASARLTGEPGLSSLGGALSAGSRAEGSGRITGREGRCTDGSGDALEPGLSFPPDRRRAKTCRGSYESIPGLATKFPDPEEHPENMMASFGLTAASKHSAHRGSAGYDGGQADGVLTTRGTPPEVFAVDASNPDDEPYELLPSGLRAEFEDGELPQGKTTLASPNEVPVEPRPPIEQSYDLPPGRLKADPGRRGVSKLGVGLGGDKVLCEPLSAEGLMLSVLPFDRALEDAWSGPPGVAVTGSGTDGEEAEVDASSSRGGAMSLARVDDGGVEGSHGPSRDADSARGWGNSDEGSGCCSEASRAPAAPSLFLVSSAALRTEVDGQSPPSSSHAKSEDSS